MVLEETTRYAHGSKNVTKQLLIVPCYNERENVPLFEQTAEKELAQFNSPDERRFGKSKFSVKKMLNLALSGGDGYSVLPLYLSIGIGAMSIELLLLYFICVLVVFFAGKNVSLCRPSVIACILCVGGVNMFMLGRIGIYLGKLFMEGKRTTYLCCC